MTNITFIIIDRLYFSFQIFIRANIPIFAVYKSCKLKYNHGAVNFISEK